MEGLILGGILIFVAIVINMFKGLDFIPFRRLIGVAAVIVAVVFVVLEMAVTVPAGNVGVKTYFGEVDLNDPLPEGLSFINPLYAVQDMSCQVLVAARKYDSASKDMQTVHVTMAMNYRINPKAAPKIYKEVGMKFLEIIIDPAASEVLKAHTALYNASDILQKRPALKLEVQKDLAIWLAKYDIVLVELALANISFDPAYEKAISNKQVEEQKAGQKVYELQQAKMQAEIVQATAKGNADAVREAAKGDADALVIKGTAEANYNTKVAASITEILLRQQYLNRWDGALPTYLSGDSGGLLPMMNVGKKEK